MSPNKLLLSLLALIIIATLYISKAPVKSTIEIPLNGTDEEICSALQNPAKLPFISYSTTDGFNECVSRCIASAMIQICPQLPPNSNVFTTQPAIKEKLLEDCTQNINQFISNHTRCPYLNCEP